jgi:hypothetical protein
VDESGHPRPRARFFEAAGAHELPHLDEGGPMAGSFLCSHPPALWRGLSSAPLSRPYGGFFPLLPCPGPMAIPRTDEGGARPSGPAAIPRTGPRPRTSSRRP